MNAYFAYRRTIDLALALAVSVLVATQPFASVAFFRWPSQSEFSVLMLEVAASSASLLDFVLAANIFLISHTQHRRLSLLRKSAGFKQLIDIMKSSL